MEKKDIIKELMMFDKAFSKASQTQGLEAWAERVAENCIMITTGHRENIIGREHILVSLKSLYDLPNLKFIWEPTFANVSDDLQIGYTSGIFTREYTTQGKRLKEIGKYTTIWKKFNHQWKMIHDIGNHEKVNGD